MNSNLLLLYPNIAEELHPTRNENLNPIDIKSGSSKYAWWLCSKGHEYRAKIYHRTRSNSGCPYCSGQKLVIEKSLECCNPELAKELHPIKNGSTKAKDLFAHSGKKVWWLCKYGHEWESTVDNRSKGAVLQKS